MLSGCELNNSGSIYHAKFSNIFKSVEIQRYNHIQQKLPKWKMLREKYHTLMAYRCKYIKVQVKFKLSLPFGLIDKMQSHIIFNFGNHSVYNEQNINYLSLENILIWGYIRSGNRKYRIDWHFSSRFPHSQIIFVLLSF